MPFVEGERSRNGSFIEESRCVWMIPRFSPRVRRADFDGEFRRAVANWWLPRPGLAGRGFGVRGFIRFGSVPPNSDCTRSSVYRRISRIYSELGLTVDCLRCALAL